MKCLNLLWPTSHLAIMCPCVIIVFDDGLTCGHGINGVAKKGDTWHLGKTYTNVDSNHSHLFNLHKLHIEWQITLWMTTKDLGVLFKSYFHY